MNCTCVYERGPRGATYWKRDRRCPLHGDWPDVALVEHNIDSQGNLLTMEYHGRILIRVDSDLEIFVEWGTGHQINIYQDHRRFWQPLRDSFPTTNAITALHDKIKDSFNNYKELKALIAERQMTNFLSLTLGIHHG